MFSFPQTGEGALDGRTALFPLNSRVCLLVE